MLASNIQPFSFLTSGCTKRRAEYFNTFLFELINSGRTFKCNACGIPSRHWLEEERQKDLEGLRRSPEPGPITVLKMSGTPRLSEAFTVVRRVILKNSTLYFHKTTEQPQLPEDAKRFYQQIFRD